MTGTTASRRFDGGALTRAVDARRASAGLQWNTVAERITAQSAELRARTNDHDVCSGALVRTIKRQTNLKTAREADMGLVMQLLVWLDRPSTDFIHAVDF